MNAVRQFKERVTTLHDSLGDTQAPHRLDRDEIITLLLAAVIIVVNHYYAQAWAYFPPPPDTPSSPLEPHLWAALASVTLHVVVPVLVVMLVLRTSARAWGWRLRALGASLRGYAALFALALLWLGACALADTPPAGHWLALRGEVGMTAAMALWAATLLGQEAFFRGLMVVGLSPKTLSECPVFRRPPETVPQLRGGLRLMKAHERFSYGPIRPVDCALGSEHQPT